MRTIFNLYCIIGAGLGILLGGCVVFDRDIGMANSPEGAAHLPSFGSELFVLLAIVVFNAAFVMLSRFSASPVRKSSMGRALLVAGLLYLLAGPAMLALILRLPVADASIYYALLVLKSLAATAFGGYLMQGKITGAA